SGASLDHRALLPPAAPAASGGGEGRRRQRREDAGPRREAGRAFPGGRGGGGNGNRNRRLDRPSSSSSAGSSERAPAAAPQSQGRPLWTLSPGAGQRQCQSQRQSRLAGPRRGGGGGGEGESGTSQAAASEEEEEEEASSEAQGQQSPEEGPAPIRLRKPGGAVAPGHPGQRPGHLPRLQSRHEEDSGRAEEAHGKLPAGDVHLSPLWEAAALSGRNEVPSHGRPQHPGPCPAALSSASVQLTGKDKGPQDKQSERERLRQVLKRLGKLRCTREGCTGSFTSIVGYLYHTQKCGKAASELETLVLRCPHCGKAYRSRAGLVYHMKSEHGPAPFLHKDVPAGPPKDTCGEANGGRRLQRKSAKVAAYYLHELAHVELAKEWPKRKVLQDLVPDDRKLKYTRPGLPAVSQEVLCKWRAEIKAYQQVQCPNQGCTCVYSSVSGLKAHLGSCTLGEFVAGKYRCRLCTKEFVSESGVKYHINAVHAEDWFEVSTTGSKRLTKKARPQPQPEEATRAMQQQHWRKKALASRRKRRLPPPPPPPPPPSAICPKRPPRLGPDPSQHTGTKACRSRVPDSESWSSGEEAAVSPPPMKPSHKRRRK
ncbi:zinc finger protein 512, partial [Sceloporus undulatus]|uniref:zinc finger protein 512 n=1 Tax=Sceloporus undulatus TaxID=8520 RepID=UPI001C4C708B